VPLAKREAAPLCGRRYDQGILDERAFDCVLANDVDGFPFRREYAGDFPHRAQNVVDVPFQYRLMIGGKRWA